MQVCDWRVEVGELAGELPWACLPLYNLSRRMSRQQRSPIVTNTEAVHSLKCRWCAAQWLALNGDRCSLLIWIKEGVLGRGRVEEINQLDSTVLKSDIYGAIAWVERKAGWCGWKEESAQELTGVVVPNDGGVVFAG